MFGANAYGGRCHVMSWVSILILWCSVNAAGHNFSIAVVGLEVRLKPPHWGPRGEAVPSAWAYYYLQYERTDRGEHTCSRILLRSKQRPDGSCRTNHDGMRQFSFRIPIQSVSGLPSALLREREWRGVRAGGRPYSSVFRVAAAGPDRVVVMHWARRFGKSCY